MSTSNRSANRNSHRCAFCGSQFPQDRLMRPPGQSRGRICFDCIRELAEHVAQRGARRRPAPDNSADRPDLETEDARSRRRYTPAYFTLHPGATRNLRQPG